MAAVDEIYHTRWTRSAFSRMTAFTKALRFFWPSPESHPTKLVQVAGTSGKGSTCQFLREGLSTLGRSACYVKPHVFDYSERFVIGEAHVPHNEVVEVWNAEVRPYLTSRAHANDTMELDFPEVSLLIALRLFEKHKVRWAAIETGIGGRYDTASCLTPVATVLTNVGRDHEELLGSEHWQRALDKAGICRPGVPLILGDDDERTIGVVKGVCRDLGTPLHILGKEEEKRYGTILKRSLDGRKGTTMLQSRHQLRNAGTALMAIEVVSERDDLGEAARRIASTNYVGRFWMVERDVFADVAHNPNKTLALAAEIGERFPRQKKILVVGVSGERDPLEVIGPLIPQAKAIIVTAAGYKGQDPSVVHAKLKAKFPNIPFHLVATPTTTLKVAKSLREKGEVIVYTGSTYMIDQALNPDEKLRHINGSYGWRERK